MNILKYGTAFILSLGLIGASALADTTHKRPREKTARFMKVYGQARPPIGYVQFCRRHPAECLPIRGGNGTISVNEARRQELENINGYVNDLVRPVTDMELYRVPELWTYPHGSGDCEDYVLLKRRMLMDRGWPETALLITVVRDENNDGHAVLTVRTNKGDIVLDNKRSKILAWNKTGYKFTKRQSRNHPMVWVSLKPAAGPMNPFPELFPLTSSR